MTQAHITGAIDYSTYDNPTLVDLARERMIVSALSEEARGRWDSDVALRAAVLSRGIGWLTPESSDTISKKFVELMSSSEKRAMRSLFQIEGTADEGDIPMDEIDRMREAFERFTGIPVDAPEAEDAMSEERDRLRLLDEAEVAESQSSDRDMEAHFKNQEEWHDKMKPRRTRRRVTR